MRRLQMAATKLGARLFRQNVGLAWVGRVERGPGTVRLGPNDIVIRNARPFHAGVEGMSDLGGWVPVRITPEMVGQLAAVYAQVEVKLEKGRPSQEQIAWISAVAMSGGRAGVARNEDDLEMILRGETDGAR